jgi:hypothetical protein
LAAGKERSMAATANQHFADERQRIGRIRLQAVRVHR